MTDTQMPTTYIATFNIDTSREREIEREKSRERRNTKTPPRTNHHISYGQPRTWMDPMSKPEVNLTGKLLNKKIVIGHGDMTLDDGEPPVS